MKKHKYAKTLVLITIVILDIMCETVRAWSGTCSSTNWGICEETGGTNAKI